MGASTVNHRRTIVLFLLSGLALAMFAGSVLAPVGPAFQGRALNAWLKDLHDTSPVVRNRAAEAVRQIGAEAVPPLVKLLRQRDSALKLRLARWANVLLPWPGSQSVAEKQVPAIQACRALGPAARPAIPELIALLDGGETVGEAMHALAVIDISLFPLSGALTNGAYSARVRRSVARRLAGGGYAPHQVVPALVLALQDADPGVSEAAAASLLRVDPVAAAKLGLR